MRRVVLVETLGGNVLLEFLQVGPHHVLLDEIEVLGDATQHPYVKQLFLVEAVAFVHQVEVLQMGNLVGQLLDAVVVRILSREQRASLQAVFIRIREVQQFPKHAAQTPDVDFGVIVGVLADEFGCTLESSRHLGRQFEPVFVRLRLHQRVVKPSRIRVGVGGTHVIHEIRRVLEVVALLDDHAVHHVRLHFGLDVCPNCT